MSVSSILAFVLAGAAVKAKSVQVARRSEDDVPHAVMNEMARELRAAKARVSELEDDVARANVQYRRDQELIDTWRERALANIPPPAGPLQQDVAALQRQMAAMQQAQLQQSQQSQLAQLGRAQYHGLQNVAYQNQGPAQNLGAQGLIAELWCNCVPSRSQVWAATDPE